METCALCFNIIKGACSDGSAWAGLLYYRLIFASKAVRMPKLHQIIERHWQSPIRFVFAVKNHCPSCLPKLRRNGAMILFQAV